MLQYAPNIGVGLNTSGGVSNEFIVTKRSIKGRRSKPHHEVLNVFTRPSERKTHENGKECARLPPRMSASQLAPDVLRGTSMRGGKHCVGRDESETLLREIEKRIEIRGKQM